MQVYEEEAEEEEYPTDDEIMDVEAKASTDGPNGPIQAPELQSVAPTAARPPLLLRANGPIESPTLPAAEPKLTPATPVPAPAASELLRADTCDLF